MTKIVICGVGGQGIILASDILSLVAMEEGYDVKKSEVHGMAQRGGSVISNCIFGKKVYSPLIGLGEGDILLAFEKLEALRTLPYLRKDGIVIVNEYEWPPITVASGNTKYPENIVKNLKEKVRNLVSVDGVKIAIELGNIRTTNVVLLGVLARFLPFRQDSWLSVIKRRVPKKTVKINKTAFLSGFSSEA
jgi:indolepyruvate ferredoxin oxidoreductase beta subunit